MRKYCCLCQSEKDIDEFNKKSSCCKKCQSEYKKRYYLKNKEKIKNKSKRHYQENKEDRLTKIKNWANKNKPKVNLYKKNYKIRNPDKIKKQGLDYYLKNLDKYNEWGKEWRKRNPEKKNAINKEHMKRGTDNLSDSYVVQAIINNSSLTASEVRKYPELIKTYRVLLLTKRLLNQKTNRNGSTTKNNDQQGQQRNEVASKPTGELPSITGRYTSRQDR